MIGVHDGDLTISVSLMGFTVRSMLHGWGRDVSSLFLSDIIGSPLALLALLCGLNVARLHGCALIALRCCWDICRNFWRLAQCPSLGFSVLRPEWQGHQWAVSGPRATIWTTVPFNVPHVTTGCWGWGGGGEAFFKTTQESYFLLKDT